MNYQMRARVRVGPRLHPAISCRPMSGAFIARSLTMLRAVGRSTPASAIPEICPPGEGTSLFMASHSRVPGGDRPEAARPARRRVARRWRPQVGSELAHSVGDQGQDVVTKVASSDSWPWRRTSSSYESRSWASAPSRRTAPVSSCSSFVGIAWSGGQPDLGPCRSSGCDICAALHRRSRACPRRVCRP